MTPVNNKSLLHFIFDQMEKLDRNEITTEDAKAQANLARQANNALKYEIERSRLLHDLEQSKSTITLRNVEGKIFDNE